MDGEVFLTPRWLMERVEGEKDRWRDTSEIIGEDTEEEEEEEEEASYS
tara:strand:- start:442 stop:585 length:144 start_codon:yes stop_codon:yes gene_type:complete